jgi:putative flavoprotein involved in K+ transport
MSESIETVIIGGGQAGLSLSYYLAQQGRDHIILEQAAQAANAWRNGRWDSFTLVTPNWTVRLPGGVYQGSAPDGFMSRAELIAYFEQYIERNRLPVRYNTRATSVTLENEGYRVSTESGQLLAKNVVMATGLFQSPKIPPFSAQFPAAVLQLHSSQYRNPAGLPPGAVLVVGSAQSGAQITEELYQSGRKVYLCTGSMGRVPRRYRGKDIVEWFYLTGRFDTPPDKLPSPQKKFAGNPTATGKDGGHTLNLHQFARDGVTLLGHLVGVADGKASFAPDLMDNLAKADQFEAEMLRKIDTYIQQNHLGAPEEVLPVLRDGYDQPVVTGLDLHAAQISTVIWAMGYRFDFSLVRLPIFDADGFPVQSKGKTANPGLYFLGLPFLVAQKSGLLLGVGEDAARVASEITG